MYLYGWDWRHAPSLEHQTAPESHARRRKGREAAEGEKGITKIVLFAHSYGGLLARTFLDSHADEVARVLSRSTYWGAPKVMFSLAFGVFRPAEHRDSRRPEHGSAEASQLRPQPRTTQLRGPEPRGSVRAVPEREEVWALAADRRDGGSGCTSRRVIRRRQEAAVQRADAPRRALRQVLRQQRQDRLPVDVVGDGIPTIVATNIYRTGEASITVGPGDGTVPLKSAIQGSSDQPSVHIQTRCGGLHQPLPGLPT